MSNKLYKLRIAFSAVCGIVCLLLIVLWVRSYWRVYSLYEQHYDAPSAPTTYVRSWVELQKGNVVISKGFKDSPMRPRSGTFQWDIVSRAQSYVRPEGVPIWGFEYSSNNERMNLAMPCWFLVPLIGAATALPWIGHFGWRFSLRTFLIAITLVAIVLGAAVYAIR
jgi:hypothetical protein